MHFKDRKLLKHIYYPQLYYFGIIFLFVFIVSNTVFSETIQQQSSNISPEELSEEIVKQNSQEEEEIQKLLNEVDSLINAKQFSDAASIFNKIHEKYLSLPQTEKVKEGINALKQKENGFYKTWSNYLESKANEELNSKNWDNSIKLANESIEILTKIKPVDNNKIRTDKKIIDSAERNIANEQFKNETSISTLIPTNEIDKEDTDLYFLHAETFIKNKQYEQARDALEKILVLDPYNFKAMYMLKNLYTKVFKTGKGRTSAELTERMAQVNWAYSQPISTKLEQAQEQLIEVKVAKDEASKIKEKLKNIIIEKIDFEDASISSVITYLNKESKRLDEIDGAGINIVLRLDNNTQENLSRITMSMDSIPFEAALKYLCLATDLKYMIEDQAVIIGNEDIEKMKTEFFTVKSDIIVGIIENVDIRKRFRKEIKDLLLGERYKRYYLGGVEDKEGEGKDRDEESSELDSNVISDLPIGVSLSKKYKGVAPTIKVLLEIGKLEEEKLLELLRKEFMSEEEDKFLSTLALKAYFLERGIDFPEGSSIAWDTRISTLTVTNTTKNLMAIENLLKEIDVEIPLVLIETKFVEITETDLKEFGFDWQFNLQSGDWGINQFNPSQVVSTASEKTDGSTILGNDSVLRHYDSTFNNNAANPSGSTTQTYRNNPSTTGAVINNLTFNLPTGGGSTGSLSLWLFALDRSGIAEVLSAPKVITKSGTRAIIRMIEEEYYPVNWTTPEVTIPENTASVQINQSVAEFEKPTELGIKFEVIPTVNPNNYTIMLELHPEVTDFVGWSDYSYSISTGSTSASTGYTQPVKMPNLSIREVKSKVVVYDGATTVLGGMIKDSNSAVDDLVPAIGEIPILGALFRSQYEQSEKVNLLIFITARLIKPDGTPFRKTPDNGLFKFNSDL